MLSGDLRVLVRVAAELFDRSYRLKDYLRRIGPGESNEHRKLSSTIKHALEQVEKKMVESFKKLWMKPADDIQEETATLQRNLQKFSRWFANIHEMLVFLPRESISPELVFSLQGYFGVLYDENHSIVLGSLFNALEFDFVEILAKRLTDIKEIFSSDEKNIVLQLAICDAHSPLSYAILGHEFGHAIDSKYEISIQVASQYVTDPNTAEFKIIHSWCQELCADLVAAHTLGPSPMCSLLSMEYCLFPMQHICEHSETHPMTRTRLDIVLEDLGKSPAVDMIDHDIKSYEIAWEFKLRQLLHDESIRKAHIKRQENLFEALIRPMAENICQKINSIGIPKIVFERNSLERCMKRLSKGLPVSAQGKRREDLRQSIAKYTEYKERATLADRVIGFKKLIDEFAESPLEIPKIVFSGYLRRSSIIEKLLDLSGVTIIPHF